MSTTGTSTAPAPSGSRIVAIDMLRGFAIIGVVLYHLWDDIRFLPYRPGWFYDQVGARVRDGEWSRVPTALLDAALRAGYLIPTFMMLSGVSLYLAAARRGGPIDLKWFYRRRLRQLMVPYWFAVAMIMTVIVAIALLQMVLHGHGFWYQYHHVTQAKQAGMAPGRWQLLASITVVPRALHSEWLLVPPTVMWFVVLIVQYYLVFPFLFPLLERFGPARFVTFALAATVAAKIALVAIAGGIDHNPATNLNHTMIPFRWFEFALGMSLGYLFVHERARLAALVSPNGTVIALVAAGLLLEIAGTVLDDRSGYRATVAAPIVIVGVTMVVLPLMTKRPGRIEASAPARLLAWAGPYSYTILIANEPLRLFASFLRVEEVPLGIWWLYLAAYLPVTLILAKPLAEFLGIAPRPPSPRPAPAHDVAHAPAEALASSGGG